MPNSEDDQNQSLGQVVVAVEYALGSTTVVLRGELDVSTAADLTVILDAAIDRSIDGSVVLDMTELGFMDAAGVGVLVGAANRLGPGRALTVRSATRAVRRVLDITGFGAMLEAGSTVGLEHHLGPEQRGGPPDKGERARSSSAPVRRLTALPSDNDVVDGALRLVVALARATVSGADGVSVSLRRHGHLSTVAASDQTILDMDADQYETGEGPCVDASIRGHWFHVQSLDDEPRWPSFTPKARELGIHSILSSPLLAEDRPIGALNIYSLTRGAFAPKDQELASVFATQASAILTEAGVDVAERQASLRFQEALRTRGLIAQAQGVIMARSGRSAEAAHAELRRMSVATLRPLRTCAEELMESVSNAGSPAPIEPQQADS